jgi:hypothetical protein
MNEADVLAFDPFEGDFGMPGDRTLKNKMVKARKAGECHLCGGQVKPGTRIRVMTEKFEGRIEYYRWCNECCKAMANIWHDDGKEYEKRSKLRTA